MKIAVLILVLANLALFAWLDWAGQTGNPSTQASLTPFARTAGQVALLSDLSATAPKPATLAAPVPQTFAVPSAVTVTPRHSSGAAQCLVWGPIAATTATRRATELQENGVPVQAFTRPGEVAIAYRVELSGFPSLGAARRAEAALRKGGITDLYVLDTSGVQHPVLSLGLFHERSGARQRAVRARELGFRPAIHVITREGVRHFLQLRMPAAASAIATLDGRKIVGGPRRAACMSPPAAITAPVEASVP